MKIAYISYYNSNQIKHWSGTIYYIAHFLEKQGAEVIRIDDIETFSDNIYRIKSYLTQKAGKSFEKFRDERFNKKIAARIEKQLNEIEYDIILSPGSLWVANLKVNKPIIIWTDAVFSGLLNFHPQYKNLTLKQTKEGHKLEKKALSKSDKIIFTSKWSKDGAIRDYKISPSKISIIPFGANLSIGLDEKDVIISETEYNNQNLKLLFIGANWENKGGNLLLKIFEKLNKLNSKYELHIVGSEPQDKPNIDNIFYYGFLDKSKEDDLKTLLELYKNSHYFILPTQAEAFGIVFCEANSFGLPVIGSELGGVPEIIKPGKNGILININKSPDQLANEINSYINSGYYKEKSLNAFQEYKNRLNWETSTRKLLEIMQEVINE